MTQINIFVNDTPMSVISPISIAELIALNQLDDTGTAIAQNHTIVSKPDWSTTYLNSGDKVDVFTLVAGG